MKDKNWGAQWGFTDKDYIEELNLDPSLEGTEAINGAIQRAVKAQMVNDYVKRGVPPARAEKIAHRETRRRK